MRCNLFHFRSLKERARGAAAFTFLEVCLTLVILAIITAVLLRAHMRSLRAEEEARWLEASRFQMERVLTAAALQAPAGNDLLTNSPEWRITAEPVAGQGKDGASWQRWDVAPTSNPRQKTTLYLRAP
jgi:type II secretory pathway pseudopilin PulG